MAVRPTSKNGLNLEGYFDFKAWAEGQDKITDAYQLRIVVPWYFPKSLPAVYETKGRIPRTEDYHVNSDGSLCLGSRLRLLYKLAENPTLIGFAKKCLIPYLYGVSRKLAHGEDFIFGQLAHGSPGELADYVELFGLKTPKEALTALEYLGMKKQKANKLACPCGCGRRLGKCRFNTKLKRFRELAERSWFRSLHQEILLSENASRNSYRDLLNITR